MLNCVFTSFVHLKTEMVHFFFSQIYTVSVRSEGKHLWKSVQTNLAHEYAFI